MTLTGLAEIALDRTMPLVDAAIYDLPAEALDIESRLLRDAVIHATEGEYDLAQRVVNQVLFLDEANVDALMLMARIHIARQEWAESLELMADAHQRGGVVPNRLWDVAMEQFLGL